MHRDIARVREKVFLKRRGCCDNDERADPKTLGTGALQDAEEEQSLDVACNHQERERMYARPAPTESQLSFSALRAVLVSLMMCVPKKLKENALTRRDAVSDALLNLGYVGVGRQPDALLSHRNLFPRAARLQHEQPQTTLSNAYQLLSAT